MTPQPPPSAPHSLGLSSALPALEWERWIELSLQQAASAPGRALLARYLDPESPAWATNPEAAKAQQALTREASHAAPHDSLWSSLSGLPDPEQTLARLKRAAILSVEELAGVSRWVRAVVQWQSLPTEDLDPQVLPLFLKTLHTLRAWGAAKHLQDRFARILTEDGDFSENASPRLSALHLELRRIKNQAQSALDQVMRKLDQKGVLQDQFADVREDRYVLPVRMGAQGEVPGDFLDISSSRQTVFIEPTELAPHNRALSRKRAEIEQERLIILQEISTLLAQQHQPLETAVQELANWDAAAAKHRMNLACQAQPIAVSDDFSWDLHQTAHPLLFWSMPAESIARNTLVLSEKTQVILFSGPNTGGKTVFLKTLGIAALCARSGFGFPSSPDHLPRIPFFDRIDCDLGDPQSIAAHLSTFSGHLLRLKEILTPAHGRHLVLLDELNSSTDPEEGYALSRAILDQLRVQGAWICATTHDPKLKALAIDQDWITNASVLFDEQTQKPTYRVQLGSPGRSRALETAERLGLPDTLIAAARQYLSAGHQAFDAQIARLESDAAAAASAREQATHALKEAKRLEHEWRARMESSLQETLVRTRAKLRKISESAQEELRSLVVQAHEKNNSQTSPKEMSAIRATAQQTLNQALRDSDQAIGQEMAVADLPEFTVNIPTVAKSPHLLEAGAQVRVPRWKANGTVISASTDQVRVQLGALQMTLKPNEVELLNSTPAPRAKVHAQYAAGAEHVTQELDLRGKRYDEAMNELRAFIDLAYRSSHVSFVRVIHGFGTGALREGTRALLAKLPYVKSAQDAPPHQGGAGATEIEFER